MLDTYGGEVFETVVHTFKGQVNCIHHTPVYNVNSIRNMSDDFVNSDYDCVLIVISLLERNVPARLLP